MKNIFDCMDASSAPIPGAATPMNTLGMGGVTPLNGDPMEIPLKKRKKVKSLMDYIKSKKL